MYLALSPPVRIFFISILFGSGFAVLWDIIRIIKKRINFNYKKTVFILDIIFFAVACVLNLTFFFIFTSGKFRFFVIIGYVVGFILYNLTISVFIFPALQIIINFIFLIFEKIFSLIKLIVHFFEKVLNITLININKKKKKKKNLLLL